MQEGHIGTLQGKVDYDQAKAAFDARDPKIIINADKTWLSVTNAEKQVDVWNRMLTTNRPTDPAKPDTRVDPGSVITSRN